MASLYACHFFQHFLIVGKHFFKSSIHHRSMPEYPSPSVVPVFSQRPPLIASSNALARLQRAPKNWMLTADVLIRYTASDTVVVRVTYFTHQVVVLVLDRRCIDRNLCTEVLETFRQFRTPQHGQSSVRVKDRGCYNVCKKQNEVLVTLCVRR